MEIGDFNLVKGRLAADYVRCGGEIGGGPTLYHIQDTAHLSKRTDIHNLLLLPSQFYLLDRGRIFLIGLDSVLADVGLLRRIFPSFILRSRWTE